MDRGNGPSQAGQRGREDGVGVYNGPHLGTDAVDTSVHRRLGRGLQRTLQNPAVHVDEHDVAGLELPVVEAARGHEHVAFRGAGADVTRGPRHKSGCDHLLGDAGHLFPQLAMVHDDPPSGGRISYFMPSWRPCCSSASTTSSSGLTPEMKGSGSTLPLLSRSKATCTV